MPHQDPRDIQKTIEMEFGLKIKKWNTASFGEDSSSQRYWFSDENHQSYFGKVVPKSLEDQARLLTFLKKELGGHVVLPIQNRRGGFFSPVSNRFLVIYPFVEGNNGLEEPFSSDDLREIGKIVRKIHSLDPNMLKNQFHVEKRLMDLSFQNKLRQRMETIGSIHPADDLISGFSDFLHSKSGIINEILAVLGRLHSTLKNDAMPPCLCHADLHAGNILKSTSGQIILVDWDQAGLGPKELDLLFFGGGIAGRMNREEDAQSFLDGYGEASIDETKLAYFRLARLVEDLSLFLDQILNVSLDQEDRVRAFSFFQSNFLSENTIDAAYRTLRRISEI